MQQRSQNLFPSGEELEALCQWSNSLKPFQQRLGKHFARSESRGAAFDYIQVLLCPVERKKGWQMAEQVGYANPYRFQHLLARAKWDLEKVCSEVKDYNKVCHKNGTSQTNVAVGFRARASPGMVRG